jgi:DNA-binding CsgD family transcriptional regulator
MKMPDGLDALTEKEKETLRLLVTGHDAKSIARELGLSVHTINDRLRDTRRKIGVTSSREAARILAQAEDTGPNKFGAKKMGVSDTTVDAHSSEQPARNKWSGVIPAWLGGGMLVLSVVVAVAVFMSSVGMSPDSENGTSMTKIEVSEAASIIFGEQWLKLVDNQNWSKSWSSAGSFFRSQISEKTWSATILSVRNPLGTLVSRSILKVTKATSLPGAPDGEYELIEFQSNFTNKSDAKETLVLMKEENTWKTVGYFIR